MHTIDLLKGQGLPAKTTLGSVFFAAMIFVVPLLVGAGMVGLYLLNNTKIEIKQGEIDRYKKEIEDLKPKVRQTAKMVEEKNSIANRLGEVSKCVDTYTQWTPVLIDVAKNLPENMKMNRLAITNEQSRNSGRRNNDPNKPLIIPIPQRKMTLEISGRGKEDFNLKVQEYQNTLKSKASLGPELLKSATFLKLPKPADSNDDLFTMNFILENQKK